ncbi:MAG: DUF1638 domain-containing protein [Thermodesulfobacteriota bacterium]|nr:DUF1638 domain-containing protein [Thermodesulfobacteriota bacterium]
MNRVSFSHTALVSCGTLSLEVHHLQKTGFLNARQIFYTTPGLHENPRELEKQLRRAVKRAKTISDKVIVIYGATFCYVNAHEPGRTMDRMIDEQGGPAVRRIQATHCIDMLASQEERDSIAQEMAQGKKIWWMTPGWITFRRHMFKGWDRGLANENFPRHRGGAIVLDALGYVTQYMARHPEAFLEYSDWMGIPIMPYTITLDRFKALLGNEAAALSGPA